MNTLLTNTVIVHKYKNIVGKLGLSVIASFILALFAQLTIPLWPVPITGQTLGLLLIGVALGPWWGTLSVLNYILLGILGVPVFAFGANILTLNFHLLGYIVGYPLTTLVMGLLIQYIKPKNIFQFTIVGIVALVPTFVLGVCWLTFFMSTHKALIVGLYPFILNEIVKVFIAYFFAKQI